MQAFITIESAQLDTITGGADSIGATAGARAAEVANSFNKGGIGGAVSAIGGMVGGMFGGAPSQGPVGAPPTDPARPGMAGLALRERMSKSEP